MNILAIDSSLNSTGFAVLNENEILHYGIIKSNKKLDTIDRMLNITRQLKDIVLDWKCEVITIEKLALFRLNSTQTIQSLSGLYFHLLCEFRKSEYQVIEVYPSEWKSYCNIKGRHRVEQKDSSIKYVKALIKDNTINDDIADAVCIGLYGMEVLKNG